MTLNILGYRTTYLKLAAAGIGVAAVLGETFIAVETLVSGYLFGFYDVMGVILGISALVLVWKRPLWASLAWLGQEAMLYNGHLLVSVACLPMLLLPLSAAGFAMWSTWRTRSS